MALYMVAVMRLVMSSHFVLHNFQIIAHPLRWDKWDLYDMKIGTQSGDLTLWFRGYKFPVNGWPVIELAVEGLGRIIAAACMLDVAGKAMKGKLVG